MPIYLRIMRAQLGVKKEGTDAQGAGDDGVGHTPK
jgi:hypothetical protein